MPFVGMSSPALTAALAQTVSSFEELQTFVGCMVTPPLIEIPPEDICADASAIALMAPSSGMLAVVWNCDEECPPDLPTGYFELKGKFEGKRMWRRAGDAPCWLFWHKGEGAWCLALELGGEPIAWQAGGEEEAPSVGGWLFGGLPAAGLLVVDAFHWLAFASVLQLKEIRRLNGALAQVP